MPRRFSGEQVWRRTRRIYTFPSPAAGVEVSIVVPGGVEWELVSFLATFTASAVVATRRPRLIVTDGSTAGVRIPANTNATASQVITYSWSQDVANVAVGTDGSTAIPHLLVETGWVIGTQTLALDTGDQFSGLAALVYESTVQLGGVNLEATPELLVDVFNG